MPTGEFRYCADPEAVWLASGSTTTSVSPGSTTWQSSGSSILATAASTSSGTVIVYSLDGCQGLWYGTFPVPASSAAIEQLIAEHRRETEKAAIRRQVADARAHQLLMSLLDDEQSESYRVHGSFRVQGSAGGLYRITTPGHIGNVEELAGDDSVVATWCCHPPGGLPDADAYIAQLLQLQCDEPGFRQAGNRTVRRQPVAA